MTYKIGIDSGGTHIVATAYENGKPLYSATAGPGNILLDPEETITNLRTVIHDIKNHLEGKKCELILCGIAGLESAPDPETYLHALQSNIVNVTKNVFFMSDAKLALLNALEGEDGFLVIAGTGSIVYSKQHNEYLRAGGWGYLLDDVGSGYRIAQEAVTHALEMLDRGKESSLNPAILDFFGEKSLPTVVSKYYQLTRPEIGNFAKKVDQLAECGDAEAIEILNHQASVLTEEIIALIKQQDEAKISYNLALSGAVLLNNKIMQSYIISHIQELYPEMKIVITNRNNNAAVNYFKEEV